MTNKDPKIQNSIIKIVGLLEEKQGLEFSLSTNGYLREKFSDEHSNFFKDYFYPDFRNLMFFKHSRINNRRFKKDIGQSLSLSDSHKKEEFVVKDAEVLLFGGDYIALFCISIQANEENLDIKTISNLLYLIRQFDTVTENNIKWCHWIENELLGGIKIRGRGVSVDEYSGSKFKIFSVIDLQNEIEDDERMKLLYDIGTSSPIGSSGNLKTSFSPHQDYYASIIENKLSVFVNWEALSLLDTFTVIGHNIIMEPKQYNTWSFTYFRIYLFRVFFKYNLYRYNSLMSNEDDNSISLRSKFEEFLNIFDTYPISYNFLPNEIFQNIDKGLNVQFELSNFHNRITRMTEAIKEKKQAQMNLLLELISVITAVTSAAAIPTIIEQVNIISGIPAIIYFAFLAIIGIILLVIFSRFLKPVQRLKSLIRFILKKKSK